MGNVVARIKIKGREVDILVELDSALRFRKTGQGSIENILAIDAVFFDSKKGLHASSSFLKDAFGTGDIKEIAKKILRDGEIQLPAEYKRGERDAKHKQIVDFLARNCIDPRTNNVHPASRIEAALQEVNIKVDDRPVQEQIPEILKQLQTKLPLRIESKKLSIKIPAMYSASVYSMLKEFKEKEEWLNDGSLQCIINIPAGIQSDFYDKLNKLTHGAAITAEIKK